VVAGAYGDRLAVEQSRHVMRVDAGQVEGDDVACSVIERGP
jgi:hypothetical protein